MYISDELETGDRTWLLVPEVKTSCCGDSGLKLEETEDEREVVGEKRLGGPELTESKEPFLSLCSCEEGNC